MDEERDVLRHLELVLAALGDRTDRERAHFLLAPLPPLRGKSAVQVLRGRLTSEAVTHLTDLARHAGGMRQ